MKFSSVFLFASLAFAAPQLAPRQQTVVGTITNSVNTLEDVTSKNFDEIKKAVDSAEDSAGAEVEATIKANYEAILSAFEDATNAITDITTDGAGGIVGDVKKLSQEQIDQLAEAIEASQRVLKGLEATTKVTVSDLSPDVQDAVQSEVDAVKGAIAPFFDPLTKFAEAAGKASATAGVKIDGLKDALKEVNGVLMGLSESLGLPELDGVVDLGGVFGGK